jgi:hypothetical protein
MKSGAHRHVKRDEVSVPTDANARKRKTDET